MKLELCLFQQRFFFFFFRISILLLFCMYVFQKLDTHDIYPFILLKQKIMEHHLPVTEVVSIIASTF